VKNNKIFNAIGKIDDELIERAEEKAPHARSLSWLKRAVPAACLAAVTAIALSTTLNNSEPLPDRGNMTVNNDGDTVTPGDDMTVNDGGDTVTPGEPYGERIALAGLPVDNFSLADIQTEGEMLADRMACVQIIDFFGFPGYADMFVFARVSGTEQREDDVTLKQTSSLQILSTVWSKNGNMPGTLSVAQSLYGGCMGDEKTNMLREGGVYFLPLSYRENEGMWCVAGDLDVLFEVDDKGLVWSHSIYGSFKKYDGKDANNIAEYVKQLTSDENFSAANTVFGKIAGDWGALAEVTVLSVNSAKTDWGYDRHEYTLRAESVLSAASGDRFPAPEDGNSIKVISYSSGYLEIGGRYLVMIDPSESGYIEESRAARVNGDGTITAVAVPGEYYTNIFTEYNGCTIEQMREEARRAKAWREMYAQ
jgi:hypothetical protein